MWLLPNDKAPQFCSFKKLFKSKSHREKKVKFCQIKTQTNKQNDEFVCGAKGPNKSRVNKIDKNNSKFNLK